MTKNMILVMGALVAMTLSRPVNAQETHLYTPEEQAGMTHDGAIATMTTPSELREYFENASKPKPTGHVTYCNAGIMGIGARGKALGKINAICGGPEKTTILRAGPMIDAVSTFVGTSCKRSEMIVFRCDSRPAKNK
ncbi:hypothetical protein [Pseudoxanthomonas sp. CF125]|uniref:hypothetical protein n=1 Tax=Pseudoxanthomonas sp. CF125 TaxID=1855303 RepID=UPI00115FA788|nr:hypothetical protein [Pseudoxanthomonas sp. CF125]